MPLSCHVCIPIELTVHMHNQSIQDFRVFFCVIVDFTVAFFYVYVYENLPCNLQSFVLFFFCGKLHAIARNCFAR